MEQHAEVLIGGEWHQRRPSWQDAIATLLVLAIVILLRSAGVRIAEKKARAKQFTANARTQQRKFEIPPVICPPY